MTDNSLKQSKAKTSHTLRRWLWRLVLAVFVVGLGLAVASAWMPKPIVVDTATAEVGELSVTVDEDGRTRVKDRYVISAPLAGNLARIELQPGDQVTAGSIVGRLLPLPTPLLDPQSRAQAQAQLAASDAAHRQAQTLETRTKAAKEFAEVEILKTRKLAGQGSIAQQALERAEFELRTLREDYASSTFGARVARHQAEMALAALGRLLPGKEASDQMQLNSSVEGVVLSVLRENEGVIQAGTPLLEIGNPKALEIVVEVLTNDAVRMTAGAKARIVRWGGPGELLARVRRIEPKAFSRRSSLGVEEQRVNVILDLESPPETWVALGDGYRVEASIVVWEEAKVVKIPASALFRRGDTWNVFSVQAGQARVKEVSVGQRNGLHAQITTGLDEGATVILHPGDRVIEGAKVVAR